MVAAPQTKCPGEGALLEALAGRIFVFKHAI